MEKLLLDKVGSTNSYLNNMQTDSLPNLFTVYTFNQTQGRGQAGNSWESEPNKNLTFSTLFHSLQIPVQLQFILSEIVPLAIKDVLDLYTNDIAIKWPNDIYWKDKKIAGILIEHSIIDGHINKSVAGVGLNINQTKFISDAPNPISLAMITGQTYNLEQLLDNILNKFEHYLSYINNPTELKVKYLNSLYRKEGYHKYASDNEIFEAKIATVADNGVIELEKRSGEKRSFAFKQLKYIL